MNGAKLQIVRRFRAPPERLFEACATPELLARWLGPEGFDRVTFEGDVRVGGRFAFRMMSGADAYGAEGAFQAVDPPRRLVLSWRWTEGPPHSPPDGVLSRVTFEIEPHGEGSQLTLTHEGLPHQAQADEHRKGWAEALRKLEALVAHSF